MGEDQTSPSPLNRLQPHNFSNSPARPARVGPSRYPMLLLLVLLLQSPQIEPTYAKGLEILKKEGTQAALDYYRKGASETGKPELLFGLAWTFWKKGDLERAEKACLFLIAKNEKDGNSEIEKYLGQTYYLLAFIYSHQATKLEDSSRCFQLAINNFRKSNHHHFNIFLSYLGLAHVKFMQSDLNASDEFLALAHKIYTKHDLDGNLGYYYEIRYRVQYARELYLDALISVRHSRAEYERIGDTAQVLGAMCSEAFLNIIIGNLKIGREIATEVDDLAMKHQMTRHSVYNAVNWVILHRCDDRSTEELENYINEWLALHEDETLRDYLSFAKSCNRSEDGNGCECVRKSKRK